MHRVSNHESPAWLTDAINANEIEIRRLVAIASDTKPPLQEIDSRLAFAAISGRRKLRDLMSEIGNDEYDRAHDLPP